MFVTLLQGCQTDTKTLNDLVAAPAREKPASRANIVSTPSITSEHNLLSIGPESLEEDSFRRSLYKEIEDKLNMESENESRKRKVKVASFTGITKQEEAEECREVIKRKLNEPRSYKGKVSVDFWDTEDPGNGEYKLVRALFPVVVGNEVECFRVDVAELNNGEKSKSMRLFLKQDPQDAGTWEGGEPQEIHPDLPGKDDTDRILQWLKEELRGSVLGVRVVDVIGVRSNSDELELKYDKTKYIVLKRKRN